jgi:hypothetical protein
MYQTWYFGIQLYHLATLHETAAVKSLAKLHNGKILVDVNRKIDTNNFYTQEPNQRFFNQQLQRQRCRRLERFNIGEKNILILKTRHAMNSAVNIYFTTLALLLAIVGLAPKSFRTYVNIDRRRLKTQSWMLAKNVLMLN